MSIGILDAASAYGSNMRVARDTIPAKSEAATTGAAGFGDMVSRMVTDTAGSLRSAESAGAAQVAGKGDLIDVVTAMSAAEMALDTVVAVRDRVVGAYSDIMKMQI